MEALQLGWTRSTALALEIAQRRAAVRHAGETSSIDVLVGIFRSHDGASEPLHLLEHAQASVKQFSESCEKADGGFGPLGNVPPVSESETDPSKTPAHSQEVKDILASAERLGRANVPEGHNEVRLRDLFGAVLLTDNEASRLLEHALGETFLTLDQVRDSYPEFLTWRPELQTYENFLSARHAPPRVPVSGFASDTTGDKDLIGIGAEVNAMAYLIAAKTLMPPLAIGLFGDWGSGKSFFMQALKRRVHKITADARTCAEPQKNIDIFKYVVQIEFNAWHYVEGELWASLVEHILRNLQVGTQDSETELQLRKKHWIGKLHEARKTDAAIQELKSQLDRELQTKNNEIAAAELEAETTRRELEKLTTQDVWDEVTLGDEERKRISAVIDAAGVRPASDSISDLVAAFEESRQLLARGNGLLAPLRASGSSSAIWIGVVGGVVLLGPLAGVVVGRLMNVPEFVQGFLALGGFATTASGALRTGNSWLRKWVQKTESIRASLDAKRKATLAPRLERIARLRTDQAIILERLERVRLEGEQKRREIRELEQELDGLTPGRVLLDFINERVGSEDYRKHLGVAALIRRDFEKLSALIQESNTSYIASDAGHGTDEDRHRINRIVLYIDDLDRCPPDRVVEVLQAVHLLMAFELFVVIVAVDSRWLSQSLRTHYDKLLTDVAAAEAAGATRQATAHDYLEKIFQIPFWIKPLPEKARLRIVHGLVEGNVVRRHPAGDQGPSEPLKGKTLVKWSETDRDRRLERESRTELRPRSLEFDEDELASIEELRALLGQSPRSVKRFVNVYRLIKASAAGKTVDFVGSELDADSRVVLFLLAIVTGLSSVSSTFFQSVVRGDAATLSDLVDKLDDRSAAMPGAPAGVSPAAAADARRLKAWLASPEGTPWKPLATARMAEWVRQVARFSYRIELT